MRTRNVLAAAILLFPLCAGACRHVRPQDDKAILQEIQSRLYQDTTLKKRDISVIVQNGVVILTGQVSTADERASAEHLAAAVGGVTQVINQLVVVGSSVVTTPPTQQGNAPERSK